MFVDAVYRPFHQCVNHVDTLKHPFPKRLPRSGPHGLAAAGSPSDALFAKNLRVEIAGSSLVGVTRQNMRIEEVHVMRHPYAVSFDLWD